MRIPDYNDLHDKYQAEQEALLAKLPICECCREPIQDDYLFDVDGELYCEECMKDLYRRLTENYEK
jgi:formylmethanofuran dehydrogenase subunit E